MTIRVKLFALARQLAGRDTLEVELPAEATVAALRQRMADDVPQLAGVMKHMMFAVNKDYAADRTTIAPGADVACLPPVSGG